MRGSFRALAGLLYRTSLTRNICRLADNTSGMHETKHRTVFLHPILLPRTMIKTALASFSSSGGGGHSNLDKDRNINLQAVTLFNNYPTLVSQHKGA